MSRKFSVLLSGSLFSARDYANLDHRGNPQLQVSIHASGVLDFLLDRTALWVGGLRKVGIDLQLRHIGLHRVAWLQ